MDRFDWDWIYTGDSPVKRLALIKKKDNGRGWENSWLETDPDLISLFLVEKYFKRFRFIITKLGFEV